MSNLHEAVERGERAKAIIDNQLFIDAFAAIEAQAFAMWAGSNDAAERERIWALFQAGKIFKALLEAHIKNGQFSGEALDMLKDKS